MEWVIIPALGLLIPISAIVLNSEVGKALAKRLHERANTPTPVAPADTKALTQRVAQLEQEMGELREQNAFLRQLRDEASDE